MKVVSNTTVSQDARYGEITMDIYPKGAKMSAVPTTFSRPTENSHRISKYSRGQIRTSATTAKWLVYCVLDSASSNFHLN